VARARSGSTWIGPLKAGSQTLRNNQCELQGRGFSASVSGGELSVRAGLRLSVPEGTALQLYLLALDNSGANSNWQAFGRFAVKARGWLQACACTLNRRTCPGPTSAFERV